MEITRKLSIVRLENTFSRSLTTFFSIGVSHPVALLSLLPLKFEKRFRKGY